MRTLGLVDRDHGAICDVVAQLQLPLILRVALRPATVARALPLRVVLRVWGFFIFIPRLRMTGGGGIGGGVGPPAPGGAPAPIGPGGGMGGIFAILERTLAELEVARDVP